MFEGITNFFKKVLKSGQDIDETSKDTAKERLHLVLMQDRANVSADFLDLMKQEIIEVIKKYVVVDEKEIDVRLTNQANDDGTNGAPALYANIPIVNIKNDVKGEKMREQEVENEEKEEEKKDAPKKRGRKPKKVVEAEKEKNEEQEENTDEDTELDEEIEIKDVDKEDSDEVENEDEDTEKEE
jgi:cell division topological specificity factor